MHCYKEKEKEFFKAGITAALFPIAKKWKQPKCSSVDDGLNRTQSVFMEEYHLAIKRNGVLILIQQG